MGWKPIMGWKPVKGWKPVRDMGWKPMWNMDWELGRNMEWELGRNMEWKLGRNPPPRMPPCIGWAELTAGPPSRATAPSTTENKIFLMMHLFSELRTANGAVRTV